MTDETMNSETASELPDIYIISLKRSEERRIRMERQAAMLKARGYTGKISFFDAVDAKKDEHLAFPQYQSVVAEIFGSPLSPGERACYASHFQVWEECAKDKNGMGGGV